MRDRELWNEIWSAAGEGDSEQDTWDTVSRGILDVLTACTGDPAGKVILEAGSGSGRISARLAKQGAGVVLVDYSPAAIELSRRRFSALGLPGRFVCADILHLPFPAGAFDMVWNAGVMEHLDEEEQMAAVMEMRRVCRPGGWLVTFCPYAGCLPYRVGKWMAERTGTWSFGTETPVADMSGMFSRAGAEPVQEFSFGFLESLAFLDYVAGSQEVKAALADWYAHLPLADRTTAGGYLLASIARA